MKVSRSFSTFNAALRAAKTDLKKGYTIKQVENEADDFAEDYVWEVDGELK